MAFLSDGLVYLTINSSSDGCKIGTLCFAHYALDMPSNIGLMGRVRALCPSLFFASSVFLKSPERIMALAFVMAVCSLVYNLGQRQLRQALQQAN